MTKENSTFRGSEPTWSNACVGNNGAPGYAEYASGFSAAANVLLEKVVNSDRCIAVDEVIYPICFNMRHSVELRIKNAYKIVEEIGVIKNIPTPNYRMNHDIGSLWVGFKKYAISIDDCYIDLIVKMDQTIADIADVDPSGETFRYPVDRHESKHLTNIGVINCHVLYHKFRELEYNFDAFGWLNKGILEEYKLRCFTAKSTRRSISEISNSIGVLREAGLVDESVLKIKVCESHNISGNEYSRVVVLIKENYQFSAAAGFEKEILGITSYQLVSLLKKWKSVNQGVERDAPDGFSDIRALILEQCDLEDKGSVVFKGLIDEITPEYLSGMHALFYFARVLRFSEYYVSEYDCLLTGIKINFDNKDAVRSTFLHVFNKSNFYDYVSRTLFFIGREDILKDI